MEEIRHESYYGVKMADIGIDIFSLLMFSDINVAFKRTNTQQ